MMDSPLRKRYHVHSFDSRQHLETYFSDNPEMVFEEDFLMFPIENLIETFKSGHIKGDILIDISIGSMIHHLYSACDFFNHIIVLKVRERCIMELKRWVDTRTGAFQWGHAVKLHADIEGKCAQPQDKEGKVRSALQHVVKCNLEKENMTEPIDLPPADCIISAWILDVICKDKDDYIKYLRKFSKLLKPGGRLILIGVTDSTYFTIHKEKFHIVKYNEDFTKSALVNEGFTIDYSKVMKRTVKSDLIDHQGVLFIAAHKKK
ncbi:nicotinamide N-methyltransferase-like isoform X2 [Engystomops pustulosus]|uniref:nicotinamide N-methyltransferase-like isoform X2 n=1 Tax=Engystomops pustulosus TaxID=76066 RepID=UPI003AFAD3BD